MTEAMARVELAPELPRTAPIKRVPERLANNPDNLSTLRRAKAPRVRTSVIFHEILHDHMVNLRRAKIQVAPPEGRVLTSDQEQPLEAHADARRRDALDLIVQIRNNHAPRADVLVPFRKCIARLDEFA